MEAFKVNECSTTRTSLSNILNREMPHPNNFFLDSKGTCFLCLKEAPRSSDGSGGVCLQSINRYLNINTSSVLVKSAAMKNLEKENMNKDTCKIAVPLCDSCLHQTNKLSERIAQVELQRMLVIDQLQTFHAFFSNPQQDEQRRLREAEKSVGSALNCEKSLEGRVLENLRQETKKKCSEKLGQLQKQSFPKLKLQRLHDPDASMQNEPISSTPKFDPDATVLLYRGGKEEDDQEEQEEIMSWDMKLFPSPSPVDGRHEGAFLIPIGQSSPLPKANPQFNEEMIEKILSEFCLKHTSPPSGKESNGRFTSNRYSCLICTDSCSANFYRQYGILQHFADVHPEKFFAHKLCQYKELSEDTFNRCCTQMLKLVGDRAYDARASKDSIFETYQCIVCPCTCSGVDALKHHMIRHHYKFIDKKLTNSLNKAVANINRSAESFHEHPSESRNTKAFHVNIEEEIRRLEAKQTKSRNPRKDDEPFSSAADDKENETSATSSTATVTSAQIMHNVCANYQQLGKKFKCTFCSKVLSPTSRKTHIINVHPETVFASVRFPETTETVFGEYCKQVLSTEATKTASKGRVKPYTQKRISCLYCKKKLCGAHNLKRHYVVEHYAIVKSKIIQCQQNSNSTFSGQQEPKLKKNTREASLSSSSPAAGRFQGTLTTSGKPPTSKTILRQSVQQSLQCDNNGCGETFGYKIALWRHKKYSCGKKTQVTTPSSKTAFDASNRRRSGRLHLNTVAKPENNVNFESTNSTVTNTQPKERLFKILHNRWRMRKMNSANAGADDESSLYLTSPSHSSCHENLQDTSRAKEESTC